MKPCRPTGKAPCAKEMHRRATERWPITMRQLWNATLTERIPDDIRDLIERLD